MFCSTIIPTVGRDTLSRAVRSVLDQNFDQDDFEVIVVNDSGKPLMAFDGQYSEKVHVINTDRHERSVARNTGAAIAKGKYLHFLDDDDWITPDAWKTFWEVSRKSDAVWIYGGYRAVDNEGNTVAEYFPELSGNIFAQLVSGEGIPLVVSLFRNDAFFKAGMYDPTHVNDEVRDLGRKIAFVGDVVGANAMLGYIRIGQIGSTSDWSVLSENDRWGREKALRLQNSFTRLRQSADTNYWRGRVSRAYFASAVWNLKRKNLLVASSRVLSGLAIASWHSFSSDFWRGIKTRIQ